MDIENLIESLHPLERKVLPYLAKHNLFSEILEASALKYVEVMRALQWMESKNILKINTEKKNLVNLDVNGKLYLDKSLPEKRFLKAISKESLSLGDIKKNAGLDNNELSVCLGTLKGKMAINLEKGKATITQQGKKLLEKESFEELFMKKKFPLELKNLKEEELFAFNNLKKRSRIVKVDLVKIKTIELSNIGKQLILQKLDGDFVENVTASMLKKGTWKKKRFRRYDVGINVPKVFPGKRHFVNQAIEYVKRIWLDLGFKEMQGPMVQTGFWNFDALFTAQDHPVRDMQDTYYIKNPGKGKLSMPKVVDRVKKTHENGWTTGSEGWQYKWKPEEALKNVLRTHTTCLSARTIANLTEKDLPAKFFAVGKNFRNETLDWSHLFELIQIEGIVIDTNANFRNLIGYLKNFFNKMGFEKVRVRPAYFPYTEPSAEVDVYHPIHKKWMELGGSGMFRPEMTKPLFGKEVPVLAWGLGFDRTILEYYRLTDIRDLYKNDLKQIKEMKLWLK